MTDAFRRLSADFAVSPQVQPADVPALRDQGIRVLVCNRPDGESPGQPTADGMAAAAAAAGLDFHYLPVVPGQAAGDQADAMAALLAAVSGPVLGYCRTGTRSAMLWAMVEAPRRGPDGVIAACQAAGYDLAALRPVLCLRAAQHQGADGTR